MPELPELQSGQSPDAANMAPNNPEAQSAKPMNEASDLELLQHLHEVWTKELLESWSAAEVATRELLKNPTMWVEEKDANNRVVARKQVRMTEDQLKTAMVNAWKDIVGDGRTNLGMLDACLMVIEHMRFRSDNLRIYGILSGDPRERKNLNIVPDEAS